MTAVGVMAESAAPTEVKNCTYSGFDSTLNISFEDSAKAWLNAITDVTANGVTYTKGTVSWGAEGNLWNIGTVSGAYGDEQALKLLYSSGSFPSTIVVKANGYDTVTLNVTSESSGYKATITTAEPTAAPTASPTPEPTPVEDTDPPTSFTVESNFGYDFVFTFTDAEDWLNAVTGVTVNGEAWSKGSSSYSVWNNTCYYVNGSSGRLMIGEDFKTNPATCVITAKGYKPLTLTLDKSNHKVTIGAVEETTYKAYVAKAENGSVSLSASEGIKKGETVTVTVTPDVDYELDTLTVKTESKEVETKKVSETSYTFVMPDANVTVTAKFKASALKVVDIDKVTLTEDTFGNDWHINFSEPSDYVENVTGFKVNGIYWEEKSYNISSGGAYRKYADDNYIQIAQKSYSASENEVPVRSGDVITISAKGYEDLNLKFVVDTSGKASLVADDGEGDLYELHVKIEGSFEAAIVGQKDYDGVSGASTGGSTSNSNSNVTVYGALVEKDKEPTDDDWQKLDNNSEIDLNGSKCKVSIVPDVESGTPEDADSGMSGVYMPISSDLTLSGTPKDAGKYLVSVSIEDKQGRKATSNTLPFMIYTGEETLAEQIKIENLKQYANGLYAWDIMEPWAIKNFGSNVDGEEESVRVPADLEVWFGSHESGTYGYLGYDLAWDEVEAGNIPQTLYIPAGCNLTLTNMEILSSVRIVVEDGGKLTLDDSVVQGIIDVQGGGTFSMNYRAYSGEFKTGASVCGQIRLADGAILENAAIYSHANYLANGDLTDRTTSEPVVVTNGNVAVKGQVFIEGDDAGNEIGQTALQVNGTLTLADGATLVAYGGGGMTYFAGGTAIDLNGTITGNGKLVAIGGAPLFGDGGTAISGSGTISTSETFLQGGTAFTSRDAKPGKALNGDITLTSQSRHVKDGTLEETGTDDPLKALYWNTGIELIPPLDTFTTEQHTDAVTDTTVWKFDENTHWNPCDDVTCSVHVNEAAHTFVWVNDEAESDISTRSIEARTKHEECTVCGYTRNENTPITPDPVVTPEPSAKPTAEPTTAPTTEPSVTPAPTTEPTATPAPTTEPTTTPAPTAAPSAAATVTPVPNNNNGSNTPKTGSDYIAVIFSISLLTVSGAAIAALVLLSKKRGKHVAK